MSSNLRHFTNKSHTHYSKERYLSHQKKYGKHRKTVYVKPVPEKKYPVIIIETGTAWSFKRKQRYYRHKRYPACRHKYRKIHNRSQRRIVWHEIQYEIPVPVKTETIYSVQAQPAVLPEKNHAGIFIAIILAIVIILLIVMLVHTITSVDHTDITSTPDTPVETSEPSPSIKETLQPQLESMISSLEGEWSIYVKDLSTDEVISLNSHKGHSASLIKLFTAGRYEQAIRDGELEETDAGDTNEALMISNSDNDAWVNLETIIGHGSYRAGYTSVTQFARNEGFSSTGRLVDQSDNWNGNGGMNWTSVEDVGKCLDEIYHGTYVSADASEKILNLMKQQSHLNKIPAGLPEGTVCANKTGELDLTQNDAAIVYGPKTDYILVVMSDGMNDGNQAIHTITEISRTVWNTMEDES